MQKHRKFIGDKRFYLMVLGVAMPIMIQNGITNFVSLLDNIMVGQVGTEQMSGVAIVNQLLFIYNLCIFGGVSGAGIFTAQYFGQGNDEGVRNTFRFKLWIGVILTATAIAVFLGAHEPLIRLYLTGDQGSQDMNATLSYGVSYMKVMLVGLPPFLFVQLYASTLRECGETMLPMKAGITAVFVNLIFNYILIYGKFGAPQLGVVGAAVATVLSRYVEMAIVLIRTHGNKEKYRFMHRFWRWLLARLGYCGGAHFLAGAPSLPPPLTPEQEKVLLARMAAGDAAARDDLITHNLRLVVYLAKKYESSGVPAENMISIGTIGLIKAVNTFTPERSIKLATYASRCIGNEILMYLRKSSNRRQEASIDEPLNVDGDGNELLLSDILGSDENQISQRLEQDAERAVLRRAVDSLSPRERQIMELRFGLADGIERTQKEAADALGISQSYISRLEKRIIHTLKVQLENE